MTDHIKAGDTIGNFRVTSVTTLHEQGETATMLTHEPTGLRWLHFTADDPVSSCAIAIATPVADDRGLPHVLEHMVLSGSKRRPGTDLAGGMMNRTVVEELNATTHSFMTNYHFSSAVESDMKGLFEVWFDAILRPELSETTFLREAGRFLPQDTSRPDGPLAYTGVVFNEMCGEKGGISGRILDEAKRHLVPDSGFGFAFGGCPSDIMSLTLDDVRAYHARWYRPSNMRVATRSRELPRELLVLADKLLEGLEAGEAEQPFVPQPRWEEPRSAVIEISPPASFFDEKKDKMPNQGILWLLPDTSDYRASLAMDLFTEEIDLGAVMDKAIDQPEDEIGLKTNFMTTSDQLGHDKVFGIYGFFEPDYSGDTLWNRTRHELDRLLDDQETAARIASEASARAERIVKTINEGGLAETARKNAFKSVFHSWIFRDDPLFGLDSSRLLAICHQFARDPASALSIVEDLLLENPHRLDLSIQKVKAGEDFESAAIALAPADKRNALSDEERRALAAREDALAASLPAAPSAEPLPETTLDDIPDDRLAISSGAHKLPVCGAKFLHLKANPSGEAWLAGFADLSDFTSEQLLMLPLIVNPVRDRMRYGESLDIHSPIINFDIGPYADTGILDGVQRRGLKFMVELDKDNLNLVPKHFAYLFQLRDPLSYNKVRSMIRRGSDIIGSSQTYLQNAVWATGATADDSLLKACSKCHAIEKVVAYRMRCSQANSSQETGELATGFVREASEVADMLHNPARWTFVLAGPEHLTMPVQDSIFETLLSAPAHPIGLAADLKFAPKRLLGKEEREAKSVPGRKVATVSVAIPAPAEAPLFRQRLEIGARLLERDYVEPQIRKSLGAYGAKISWRDNVLRLESRQNPDVGDTLGLVRSIRDFVAQVEWTADDVRQATLAIAGRFVNCGRESTRSMVRRCLADCISGLTPARIRSELKRIAAIKPESIRETLLEALDAGIGRETVRVEASEEAIAEANSVLPEALRLHVMGMPA
jgi:Zn-dependent M16 (insulinase) family peptidase